MPVETVTGRVSIAQEDRFLLEDELGGHKLFLLAPDSPLTPADLRALCRSGQKLRVGFSSPRHLIAGVAHTVEPADRDGRDMAAHGLAAAVKGFFRNWALPRQIAGQSSRSDAARSSESEQLRPRLMEADKVGTSICAYCAVGCAQLVYAKNGKVIHVEGDPRSPINQGTLCPKGAATLDLLTSPLRLNTVLYRAPGSDHWENKPLDWAMDRIATLVKQTRDETFVTQLPNGTKVNHTLAIGSLGGATLDNEENYLIKKLYTALGVIQVENQARI